MCLQRSRLTAGTPPGVGDLSKFERSSSELGVGLKKKKKTRQHMRNTIQTFFFIQHQLTATVKLLCIVKARNKGRPPMTAAKMTPDE